MAAAVVRRVRPTEYDVVAELTATVYRYEGYADASYEPALRRVAERDRSAEVLVAHVGDRIVGAVTIATHGGEWAEQAGPGEAVIRMLAVAADARRSGAGEVLVRSCLERARTAGCTRVRLSTMPTMTAAHRLYERIGFVRVPAADWEPAPGTLLLGYAVELG